MSDLAEKILEAISAKEVLACATSGLTWRTHDTHVDQGGHCAVVMRDDGSAKPLVAWLPTFKHPGWDVPGPWADAAFIADNDPEDVLRGCAADRETVEEYQKLASVRVEALSNWERGYRVALGKVLDRLARSYGVQP